MDDGITPSMKNIRKTWKKQKLTTKKEEIKEMLDEFMKLMSEEKDKNVKIEILTDDEENENFLDDEKLKQKPSSKSFNTVPSDVLESNSFDDDASSQISSEDEMSMRSDDFSDDGSGIGKDDEMDEMSSEGDDDEDDDEEDEEDEASLKEQYLRERDILNNEIASVKHQIETQHANLMKTPNPTLKQRFESQLQQLNINLKGFEERLEFVSEKLQKF
jgi:TATA-binding protein-associated factor Taf7